MHTSMLEKRQAFECSLFTKLTQKARKMARSAVPVRHRKLRIPSSRTKKQACSSRTEQQAAYLHSMKVCDKDNNPSLYAQHCSDCNPTTYSSMLTPASHELSYLHSNGTQAHAPFSKPSFPDTAGQMQELNLVVSAFLMGVASAKLLCGAVPSDKSDHR